MADHYPHTTGTSIGTMTYLFKCESCGERQEHDSRTPTRCKLCHAEGLRRVYTVPNVHFKGSGFFCVDKRAKTGIRGQGSSIQKTGRYADK